MVGAGSERDVPHGDQDAGDRVQPLCNSNLQVFLPEGEITCSFHDTNHIKLYQAIAGLSYSRIFSVGSK